MEGRVSESADERTVNSRRESCAIRLESIGGWDRCRWGNCSQSCVLWVPNSTTNIEQAALLARFWEQWEQRL
jgi:hypothetical protein